MAWNLSVHIFKDMVNFAIFPSAGLHFLGFLPSCVGEWTVLECSCSPTQTALNRGKTRGGRFTLQSAPSPSSFPPFFGFPSTTVVTKGEKNVFFFFFFMRLEQLDQFGEFSVKLFKERGGGKMCDRSVKMLAAAQSHFITATGLFVRKQICSFCMRTSEQAEPK